MHEKSCVKRVVIYGQPPNDSILSLEVDGMRRKNKGIAVSLVAGHAVSLVFHSRDPRHFSSIVLAFDNRVRPIHRACVTGLVGKGQHHGRGGLSNRPWSESDGRGKIYEHLV